MASDYPLVMADGTFWQVVGGKDKGGIMVREGKDTSSPLAEERLGTGSFIRELELEGERLHYKLVIGSGPSEGWVSTVLKGKNLLVSGCNLISSTPQMPSEPVPEAPPLKEFLPVNGRDICILALHGSASNINILKFQTARLRKVFGKGIRWVMPDGIVPWKKPLIPPGAQPNNWYEERSDGEKFIAKDMPFTSWLDLAEYDDGSGMDAKPDSVPSSVDWFLEQVAKEEPDVIMSFSQGASLVAFAAHRLQCNGQPVPWRLNFFFNPSPQGRYTNVGWYKSLVPTWMVTSPSASEYQWEMMQFPEMYPNLTVLEHDDGHAFPQTNPRAGEIYDELAAVLRQRCLGGDST